MQKARRLCLILYFQFLSWIKLIETQVTLTSYGIEKKNYWLPRRWESSPCNTFLPFSSFSQLWFWEISTTIYFLNVFGLLIRTIFLFHFLIFSTSILFNENIILLKFPLLLTFILILHIINFCDIPINSQYKIFGLCNFDYFFLIQ